jgi:putative inorganic carbon (hco3(-)) transporter
MMIIDFAALAIVLAAAMAWGANRAFLMVLFSSGLLLAFTCKLILFIWSTRFRMRYSPLFLPIVAFFLLVALQLANPVTDINAARIYWPHTVEPHTTRNLLFLVAGYAVLCFSIINSFNARKQISIAVICILGLGVFESLYGFVQQVGGYEFVWTTPTRSLGAQGTLMNHNHFALLLNIAFCTGIGFLYRRATELFRGQKTGLRSILSMAESPKLFSILLWIGLIGFGVLLSLSRTGIFAMFAAMGSMLVAVWYVEKRKFALFLIAVVLLVVMGLGIYAGMDAAFERYANLARNWQFEESRTRLWKDALPMIAEAPLWGTGLGSFQWIYPAHESLDPDIPAMYAHNDYLQLVIEVGIVGLGLAIWAMIICCKSAIRNLMAENTLRRSIGLATLGSLVAVAIQEIVDYSLYMPGIAAVLLLLVSLNELAGWLEKETNTEKSPNPDC